MKEKLNKVYSKKEIFRQWFPLALSTSILFIEVPIMLFFISRMEDPSKNIIAFSMGLGFIFILNSTVQYLTSVSAKLSKNKPSFFRLLRFSLIYSTCLVVCGWLFLTTPIFEWFFEKVLSINDSHTMELIKQGCLVLSFSPLAVAWRRVYQGRWIKREATEVITLSTLFRLFSGITIAAFFYLFHSVDGVMVGAYALVISAFVEAIVVTIWRKQTKRNIPATGDMVSISMIWKSHYPLAITGFLLTLDTPIFLIGISNAPNLAEESLVVWQIVLSFIYMIGGVALELQNITINLSNNVQSIIHLRNFSLLLGISLSAILLTVVVTPLGELYYIKLMGLQEEYFYLANVSTAIMLITPIFFSIQSNLRGRLICLEKEKYVERSMYINIIVMTLVLLFLNMGSSLPGAMIAAISLVSAMLIETATLYGLLKWISHIENEEGKKEKTG